MTGVQTCALPISNCLQTPVPDASGQIITKTGNQSEKPELRNIIDNLKSRNNIKGRTIHVADKGLNCSDNITHSLLNGDGYIFSKSVKQLPQVEKDWILLKSDYQTVYDNNHEIKYQYKECIDEFPYVVTDINGKKKTVEIKEKRNTHVLGPKCSRELCQMGFCFPRPDLHSSLCSEAFRGSALPLD